jgi:hypothetical protein
MPLILPSPMQMSITFLADWSPDICVDGRARVLLADDIHHDVIYRSAINQFLSKACPD